MRTNMTPAVGAVREPPNKTLIQMLHGRFAKRPYIVLFFSMMCFLACENTDPHAYAARVSTSQQLIGGPGAIGTVGDYILGNDRIRVIIQDQGWSRGFGVFGGGIIDADIVRPSTGVDGSGGLGLDNFGELFPALFLQAFDVDDQKRFDLAQNKTVDLAGIEVINDGSDGKAAVIRTRAKGGDFLTMAHFLLSNLLPSVFFETDYILEPGASHVRVVGRLISQSNERLTFPTSSAATLESALPEGLDLVNSDIPLGEVALFGGGNTIFAPGSVSRRPEHQARLGNKKPIGFDLRFAVEESYKLPPPNPAPSTLLFPGMVTDFLATAGDDVSYGFAVGDSERNYTWRNRDYYGRDPQAKITKHSMLVPFLISAFAAVMYEVPPTLENFGDTFEYTRYFIVGNGDVSSIRDELYKIRGIATGTFAGQILSEHTGQAIQNAWVHIFDQDGNPYNQMRTNTLGEFVGELEPGTYTYQVTSEGRYPFPETPDANFTFTIDAAGDTEWSYIRLPDPAILMVDVRDGDGRALPAKVTVVGEYGSQHDELDPKEFLFQFHLGASRKPTDLTWRDPVGQRKRQFIQAQGFARNGFAVLPVRPSRCDGDAKCTYQIYISHGPEYTLHVEEGVTLKAGETTPFRVQLLRAINTDDYLSADFHVHGGASLDSSMAFDSRVITAAAEGLEVLVSTDHNVITDYRPTIGMLGLNDWVRNVVGVELSTLEMGHFNGFPLKYTPDTPSHFPFVESCFPAQGEKARGIAFDWVQCSPDQLFSSLRAIGSLGSENTIIQVNHPRDAILGYFHQYYTNSYTMEAEPPGEPSILNPDTRSYFSPNNVTTKQFAAGKFSVNFDAIEVFNGKRMDMNHPFRVPIDVPDAAVTKILDSDCNGGHPENGAGKILLDSNGQHEYPGAVDDWLHLLNRGLRITATGNSDSHDTGEEIGNPRTYFHVTRDSNGRNRDGHPGIFSDRDLVDAFRSQRVTISTGPFLLLRVRDASKKEWHQGSLVPLPGSDDTKTVTVVLDLRTAPWISVDTINIYANGEIIHSVPVDRSRAGQNSEYTVVRTFSVAKDVVLVAEAVSTHSMFPVATPNETPPANISEALTGITGSLTGGGSTFAAGILSPDFVQKVYAYALTNPIWLDVDNDGHFDPPGNTVSFGPAPKALTKEQCAARAPGRSVGRSVASEQTVPESKGDWPWDIRRVFMHISGHH